MHRSPSPHTVSHRGPDPVRYRPPARRRRTLLRRAATGAVAMSVVACLVDLGSAAAVPAAALPAVADTFVNAGNPWTSYGTADVLRLDAGPKTALVTFALPASGPGGRRSAVLRLHATPTSAAATVTVHRVARTSWDERTTTSLDAPRIGPPVASGFVGPDGRLDIPVVAVPDSGGLVSLALTRSDPGRDVQFWSRESAAGGPLLSLGPTAEGGPGTPRPVGAAPPARGASAPSPSAVPGPVPASGPTAPAAPAPGVTSLFLPYETASFFRTPLPDNAPLDPQSALGIGLTKLHNGSPYPKINGVGGNRWGMPYAMSTCQDPVWRLTGTVPAGVGFLRTEGFHAPAAFAAGLTGTSDSPFVVIDRCGVPSMARGLTVWAAKAAAGGPGVISVGSAGAFAHDSNGLDRRDPLSDSTRNLRSRGAIPDAMVIRDDLLSAAIATGGDLGHVLHMFWWETSSAAGTVHPMVGSESGKTGFGAEGMRLRIKPGVDLAARHCTPAGLAVARTLQHYGAYLGDNSGSGSALKAEQGSTALTSDALSCLTWDDFAFVQRGWDPSLG